MIDIHCHILPGLDDGPKDFEESLRMCAIAEDDGIKRLIATPHINPGLYDNNKDTIISVVNDLNDLLKNQGIDLEILIGADVHLSPDIPQKVKEEVIPTLGYGFFFPLRTPNSELRTCPSPIRNKDSQFPRSAHVAQASACDILPVAQASACEEMASQFPARESATSKRYLLLELPPLAIPSQTESLIFELLTLNVVPIITHPERNPSVQEDPNLLYNYVNMGAIGQVTAMSLTGEFGREARKCSEILITHHLVHAIASDAHSSNLRPPILSRAFKAAADIIGKEESLPLVEGNPQKIINGQELNTTEPSKYKKKISLFSRKSKIRG